jgi:hypothetical protein
VARRHFGLDRLADDRDRVVGAERLQEGGRGGREVAQPADDDGSDSLRRQRFRGGGVEAAAVEQPSLVEAGCERPPQSRDEAQAFRVGRGRCGRVQVLGPQLRGGQAWIVRSAAGANPAVLTASRR